MLKQNLESELKKALKKGEELRLSTLRFLLAGIQNEEIAKQREATDEDVIAVAQRQVKQHHESIEAYQKANRSELVSKEQAELEILNTFLPPQLSEEEIRKIVVSTVEQMNEADKKNFGKVMGQVMAQTKGKTDGNTVAKVVKELLDN